MKILNYIFGLILLSGLMISCSDDDYTKLNPELTAEPVISSPVNGEEFILLKENATQTATTITWSETSVGVDTPVTAYIIEMALAGTDFVNPINVANTTETTYAMTVAQLNSKAIEAGLLPEVPGSVELRVSARIGGPNGYFIPSANVTLNITPYTDVLDLSTPWGVVGSATPNGWAGPDVPFWKMTGVGNENKIVAYATLVEGAIKFRMNNSWDAPNINYGGSSGTLNQEHPLVEGGGDIMVTAGSYKITIDLGNLTYKLEEYSLGIVGDATPNGWDGPDVQMIYDPTSDQFRAVVELANGNIKFRLNNAWNTDENWGGSNGEISTSGGDIPVTAGKYVVTVNFNEMTYTLEAIENIFGLVGSATPNGWDGPDVQLNIDYTSEYTTGGKWYINNVQLLAGAVKFRADNDWAVNYGGSGLTGPLVQAGGDIMVDVAGNYNVVMDLSAMTYSITPVE